MRSSPLPIRLGFIGAGSIFRDRHLPNLRQIEGVQFQAVANRSLASSRHIAEQFGVAQVVDDWQDLLEREDIDAVMIGTWPYMHRQVSLAALRAKKHVFCQARMAMDLSEARDMAGEAARHANLVSVVCPCPHRMPFEPYVRRVLESGELGDITLVELISRSSANSDLRSVHWRERAEFSGNQALAMGIHAELLNAWLGPYRRLSAATAIPRPHKTDQAGSAVTITIPQVITITGELERGSLIVEQHSGLVCDTTTPLEQITIWGTGGTLRHRFFTDTLERALPGEALAAVAVPDEGRRPWRVEEDFIEAVRLAKRGQPIETGMNPTFAEGLLYMRKVEAVHRAAATGAGVAPANL